MVQINSNNSSASSSRGRGGKRTLYLAYMLIGAYIVYYMTSIDQGFSEGDVGNLATSSNKAHKVESSFVRHRQKLLSLVNDPERINKETTLYDGDGNLIDPSKIVIDNHSYKFPESKHAHTMLDGLLGIEIGARSYQGFGLSSINVDLFTSNKPKEEGDGSVAKNFDNAYEATAFLNGNENELSRQMELAGIVRNVDVSVAIDKPDHLPFDDESLDFVLANRLLSPPVMTDKKQSDADPFTWDPIMSLCEWGRVVKDGGFIYAILPNKDKTFWHREKKSTHIKEVVGAHMRHVKSPSSQVDDPILWTEEDAKEFLWYMGLNLVADLPQHDSVLGGYAIVVRVERKHGMISTRCLSH